MVTKPWNTWHALWRKGTLKKCLNDNKHCNCVTLFRISTAMALVWSQDRSYGICGGQSDICAGFLLIFRFVLLILIPTKWCTPIYYLMMVQFAGHDKGTKWTQCHIRNIIRDRFPHRLLFTVRNKLFCRRVFMFTVFMQSQRCRHLNLGCLHPVACMRSGWGVSA
jgi:hypothetical protein